MTMNKSVKRLQEMISKTGVDILIDGLLGPQTRAAIKELNIPEYLKTAMYEIGTREIKGSEHNDRVVYYHSFSAGKYSTDEVPWCGSFVAMCMKKAGYDLPKYPERALSWLNFETNLEEPKIGSIAVKGRKGGGHVGFVVATDGEDLYLLGGNQNDEVNIRRYKVKDFIDFRGPRNYGNYYTRFEINADNAGREA
jgi:uncharacterized protein (TIGR02594 family)